MIDELKGTNWPSLIKRYRDEARRTWNDPSSDGLVIIQAAIGFDAKGNPVGWVIKPGLKVEPARAGRELLKSLSDM